MPFKPPPGTEYVPNDRLREAFLESGLTAQEVARRCGWFYTHRAGYVRRDGTRKQRTSPNGTEVRRVLGLKANGNYKGTQYVCKSLRYETALEIARALELDPVDVGL